MTPRLNPFAGAPAPMQLWLDFGKAILRGGLEDRLTELVKIRAPQINGCAFCLHRHTAGARKLCETEERLYLLDAWRESPLYSERERAALGWTEALTLVPRRMCPMMFIERCKRSSPRRAGNAYLAYRRDQRPEPHPSRLSRGASGRRAPGGLMTAAPNQDGQLRCAAAKSKWQPEAVKPGKRR